MKCKTTFSVDGKILNEIEQEIIESKGIDGMACRIDSIPSMFPGEIGKFEGKTKFIQSDNMTEWLEKELSEILEAVHKDDLFLKDGIEALRAFMNKVEKRTKDDVNNTFRDKLENEQYLSDEHEIDSPVFTVSEVIKMFEEIIK